MHECSNNLCSLRPKALNEKYEQSGELAMLQVIALCIQMAFCFLDNRAWHGAQGGAQEPSAPTSSANTCTQTSAPLI